MRLHLQPRLDMTSTTSSCPTYLYALPRFATTFFHVICWPPLQGCLFLSLPTSSLLARFALLRVLVVNLSPFLQVPSPASYLPLRHLPCRPLAFSILLRLIAVQNGFVLVQQHRHELLQRSIPLLFRNSYRLHRFIPRFLIQGFRPSDEIDRLYFPSLARPVLLQEPRSNNANSSLLSPLSVPFTRIRP